MSAVYIFWTEHEAIIALDIDDINGKLIYKIFILNNRHLINKLQDQMWFILFNHPFPRL